ncbi:MAG: hypothetical protein DRO76_04000 [Candidatus Altiarchaeales archaeon]|nr:MAG: hypothetical protein DRO76_04000 [Candidatus Altiarchaeales archaeon]
MMKTRDIAKQIYKIYNELKRDSVSALNVISKEIKRGLCRKPACISRSFPLLCNKEGGTYNEN